MKNLPDHDRRKFIAYTDWLFKQSSVLLIAYSSTVIKTIERYTKPQRIEEPFLLSSVTKPE